MGAEPVAHTVCATTLGPKTGARIRPQKTDPNPAPKTGPAPPPSRGVMAPWEAAVARGDRESDFAGSGTCCLTWPGAGPRQGCAAPVRWGQPVSTTPGHGARLLARMAVSTTPGRRLREHQARRTSRSGCVSGGGPQTRRRKAVGHGGRTSSTRRASTHQGARRRDSVRPGSGSVSVWSSQPPCSVHKPDAFLCCSASSPR